MIRSERGSALGYFLAALLGAIVGGLVVVQLTSRGVTAPAVTAPPVAVTQTAAAPSLPGTDNASVTRAVQRVGPAVVGIKTKVVAQRDDVPDIFRDYFGDDARPMPQQGQGSGVIIDARRGYVLTNAHVVKGARSITVTLSDKNSVEGKVVGVDSQSDLAVVRIAARSLPQAELARGGSPPIGSWVVAIGNPFGYANTVTVGVISATEREIRPQGSPAPLERLIQTDAAINPGNSGGPLCNLNGEVIGINTAILSVAQGIGFAISSEHARSISQQLIERGKVVRPWIGITYRTTITPEQREYFELPNMGGALVESVESNGPAGRAGLEPGDLIVEIERVPIKEPDDLKNQVLKHKVGDTLSLLVYRGKDQRVVKLRTAEMPVNQDAR